LTGATGTSAFVDSLLYEKLLEIFSLGFLDFEVGQ